MQANLGITRDGAARASPPFSHGARRPMNCAPQQASPAISSSASTSSGSGRWISSLRGDSGGRSVSLTVDNPRCAFEVVLRWSMGREHVVRVLDLQNGTWGEKSKVLLSRALFNISVAFCEFHSDTHVQPECPHRPTRCRGKARGLEDGIKRELSEDSHLTVSTGGTKGWKLTPPHSLPRKLGRSLADVGNPMRGPARLCAGEASSMTSQGH